MDEMDEKEIQVNAERYCELLLVYDNMLEALEKVTKKLSQTREELIYLEGVLQINGVKIKDVEVEKWNQVVKIFLNNLIEG